MEPKTTTDKNIYNFIGFSNFIVMEHKSRILTPWTLNSARVQRIL